MCPGVSLSSSSPSSSSIYLSIRITLGHVEANEADGSVARVDQRHRGAVVRLVEVCAREDGDALPVEGQLVARLADRMRPNHKGQTVRVEKVVELALVVHLRPLADGQVELVGAAAYCRALGLGTYCLEVFEGRLSWEI